MHAVMSYIGAAPLTMHPETQEFMDDMAERYEVSPDGLTFTFYFKEGIKFHSGKPFTAADLKATYERALDPATQTVTAHAMLGPIDRIEAPDDRTLVIHLKTPFAPFMTNMTSAGYLNPMDPTRLEAMGADYGRNPSSVGPYKFKSWITGMSIVLERNPDYKWAPSWYKNQGPAYFDEIEFKFIPEDATRMAALEAGEIHISSVALTEVDRFKNNPNFNVYSVMASGVNMSIWFNHEKEPMNDIRFRQAVSHAIDREAIIRAAIDGHGVPAYGPLPPTIWGYWDGVKDLQYKLDLARANALLDEMGYTQTNAAGFRMKDGKELKVSLFIMPTDAWQRSSQLIQAQLKRIGINVEIQSYEWGTLMQFLSEGRHDMNLMGYGYSDPDILYLTLHSSQAGRGLNWAFLKNPEIDALIEASRVTLDPDARGKIVADLQAAIVKEAPWVPIYTVISYTAVNKKIEGVFLNFRGTLMLHDAWMRQ